MEATRRAVHGARRVARAPIPAILNPGSGSAARARAALASDARFRVRELAPARIVAAIRAAARRGTPRLLVCGGDGTLCAAIGAAAGTGMEIAVFPGGTLNHFARDLGLPLDDPALVLDVAVNGRARAVDLGTVNGHPILNTSSVGVYVDFVRRRERHERRMDYRPASVAAAVDVWRDLRALDVDLRTADGAHHRLRTPLLFVGVHERVLERAGLGMRREDGARALQILVVKEHTPARVHALAVKAAARGIETLIADDEVERLVTTSAVVAMPRRTATIAVDGELLNVRTPLKYDFVPRAAEVVHG
jgi:diacylglycerol kinase family enzyme